MLKIVFAVSSKGNTLYWTGFDLSSHEKDAAPYSKDRTAKEAVVRAGKHYPLLTFRIKDKGAEVFGP